MGDFLSSPDLAASIRGMQQQIDALKRAQSGVAAGRLYAEELSLVSTLATGVTDLGGPSITVDVPESATFLEVFAEVEMRGTSVGDQATVFVVDSLEFPAGDAILVTTSTSFVKLRTSATGVQGTTALTAQTRLYPVAPGSHTISLRYSQPLPPNTVAEFKNRKLRVWLR